MRISDWSPDVCSSDLLIAQIIHETFAPGGAALEGERRIELVRAGVDPGAQRLAAGLAEGGLQQVAVLDGDDLPAHRAEQLVELAVEVLVRHRVKTLAVVIDHPPGVAQVVLPADRKSTRLTSSTQS